MIQLQTFKDYRIFTTVISQYTSKSHSFVQTTSVLMSTLFGASVGQIFGSRARPPPLSSFSLLFSFIFSSLFRFVVPLRPFQPFSQMPHRSELSFSYSSHSLIFSSYRRHLCRDVEIVRETREPQKSFSLQLFPLTHRFLFDNAQLVYSGVQKATPFL